MNTCCICVKPFEARELYVASHGGDGCSNAPLICSRCRLLPDALNVARDLLKEHLRDIKHPPVRIPSYDPWIHIPKVDACSDSIRDYKEGQNGQVQ